MIEQTGNAVTPHPGRPPVRWQLDVGIDPAPLPPPPKTSAAKVGFGGVSLLAIGARFVFVALRSSSSHSWTPPPSIPPVAIGCDAECTQVRLVDVRETCKGATAIDCNDEAASAESSFVSGDCDGARRSLQAILTKVTASEGAEGILSAVVSAQVGLLSCTKARHDGVVMLTGADLTATRVNVPFREGTDPFAIYV